MSDTSSLVKKFHSEMIDLIKKYQFRDRNTMASCGMSVSQCYILETLNRFGPLSMQQLADKMHLSISTMTRVIAPLIAQKFINREEDPGDRRIKIVQLTEAGNEMFISSWKNVMESEKMIIESFPLENREILVEFLQKLNKAFGNWNNTCCKK